VPGQKEEVDDCSSGDLAEVTTLSRFCLPLGTSRSLTKTICHGNFDAVLHRAIVWDER
jgi:hypothetical protein